MRKLQISCKLSILTSIISEWMFNEEKSENGILQLDENSKMERKCSSQGLERRGDGRLRISSCLSN